MFETLFGEGSYGLKFVLAFIVVLALIGLTAWLVRRFGSERLGTGATRGRQPRLAVIDAASVDGRRRLVLIRRDNVEHLMMIGGPTDVVVEANIVRGAAPARDVQPPRAPAAPDTLPRTMPIEGNMWPLQPEPAPTARVEPPPPRVPQRQTPPPPAAPPPLAVEESAEWVEEPELAPQPPAMAPPPPLPPQPAPLRRATRAAPEPFAGLADELARVQPQAEPTGETRPTGPDARPVRREPRMPRAQGMAPPPPQQQPAPAAPQPPAPAAEGPPNSPADQNLAEMAQRLEAALRRPAKPEGFAEPAPRQAQPAFEPDHADTEDYVPPRAPAPGEARPARNEVRPARSDKTAAPKSSLYDSLEQEMASLLNRPK